jgi:hypothetical protein
VHAGVVGLFVAVSFRYARAIPDAARLTFPLLTATASDLWGRRLTGLAPRERGTCAQAQKRGLVLGGVGLMLELAAYLLIQLAPSPFSGFNRRTVGWGLSTPPQLECATMFLVRYRLSGHVFGTALETSWLLFRLWPAMQSNVDGRLYAYGAELLRTYDTALREPEALRIYLRRFPTHGSCE